MMVNIQMNTTCFLGMRCCILLCTIHMIQCVLRLGWWLTLQMTCCCVASTEHVITSAAVDQHCPLQILQPCLLDSCCLLYFCLFFFPPGVQPTMTCRWYTTIRCSATTDVMCSWCWRGGDDTHGWDVVVDGGGYYGRLFRLDVCCYCCLCRDDGAHHTSPIERADSWWEMMCW